MHRDELESNRPKFTVPSIVIYWCTINPVVVSGLIHRVILYVKAASFYKHNHVFLCISCVLIIFIDNLLANEITLLQGRIVFLTL